MCAELEPDALRHHVLLAAGVDEQQVLLPVVEEAEVLFRRAPIAAAAAASGAGTALARISGSSSGGESPAPAQAVLHHELVDPLQRLGRDARAVAQPRDELAVVHRATAEGGLGHAGAPAEVRDAAQQRAAASDFHLLSIAVMLLRENRPLPLCGTSTTNGVQVSQ